MIGLFDKLDNGQQFQVASCMLQVENYCYIKYLFEYATWNLQPATK